MNAPRFQHQPRKRFGQNFLVDEGVIHAIVAAIRPLRGETLVEIGPGHGALTRPLLASAGAMHAIEIDRDLARELEHELAPSLTVHAGDALKFDFSSLGGDLRVIGNLPYYISTPLLFHIAEYASAVRDVHVMLQDEVVARMVAAPGSSGYGRLSVMLQYRFDLEKLLDVPASAFRPVPAVESAVVRLVPQKPPRTAVRDEHIFARLVTAAFSQRRKTLRNSLRDWTTEEDFEHAAVAPGARAQELSVGQFALLADLVAARAA